jgi:transcriptional regulatory protein RtcR
LGGSGPGKTVLARRVYELKKQQGLVSGPLIEVDCDVLHGDEAVRTLFGEGRGGKADAGILAAAAGGMLLLDDADQLEADVQKLLLKVLEAGWFTRRGSEKKTAVDFELISTAEGNLQEGISLGLFREDFLSQIGLWTFTLPALKGRPEDILHNIMFLLRDYEKQYRQKRIFDPGALEGYLEFAQSPEALWKGNFRTLNQSIKRMYFSAKNKTIEETVVAEEIGRLRAYTGADEFKLPGDARASVDTDYIKDNEPEEELILPKGVERILAECDEFDRVQLRAVIKVCRESETLAAAGRRLYAQSRQKRVSYNDSDRLKKYLARFGLDWDLIRK